MRYSACDVHVAVSIFHVLDVMRPQLDAPLLDEGAGLFQGGAGLFKEARVGLRGVAVLSEYVPLFFPV